MSEDWIESARQNIADALGVSVDEFAEVSADDARAQLAERQAEKQKDYDAAQGKVNKRVAVRALKAINEVVEISEKWFDYQAIDSALNEVLSLVESGKRSRANISLRLQKGAAEAFGGSLLERFNALQEELAGPSPEEIREQQEAAERQRELETKRAQQQAEAQRQAEEAERKRIEALEAQRLAEAAETKRLEQQAQERLAAEHAEQQRKRALEQQIRQDAEAKLKKEAEEKIQREAEEARLRMEAQRKAQEAQELEARDSAARLSLEAELRTRIEREIREKYERTREPIEAATPVRTEVSQPNQFVRTDTPVHEGTEDQTLEPCERFSFALSSRERLHVLASKSSTQTITLGRYRSSCTPDLPLMNAVPKDKEETIKVIRMISRRHGSLVRKGNDWYLIDAWDTQNEASTNGIYLDGEQSISIPLMKCDCKTITFSSPTFKEGLPAFEVILLENPDQQNQPSILLKRIDAFKDHILLLNNSATLPLDLGGLTLHRVDPGFKINGSTNVVPDGHGIVAFNAFEPIPFEEVFYQRGA
jgi:hypothetical protein